MSITYELRKYAKRWPLIDYIYRDMLAIADRIDAEHESKVSYWQEASYKDGYDEGFASADDWLAQHEDAMAEHGWVKLPKDADGVPIHIGDMMTISDSTDEVEGILRDRYLVLRDGDWMTIRASLAHHYKQPTVEDVLEELLREYDRDDSELTNGEIIERFAARLRLAGDGDE